MLKTLAALVALALASCKSSPREAPAGKETLGERHAITPMPTLTAPGGGGTQENAPYVGYPGPVGLIDGGPAGPVDAGVTATGDAGPPPPSTAMPGARPVYPDAGRAPR